MRRKRRRAERKRENDYERKGVSGEGRRKSGRDGERKGEKEEW